MIVIILFVYFLTLTDIQAINDINGVNNTKDMSNQSLLIKKTRITYPVVWPYSMNVDYAQ